MMSKVLWTAPYKIFKAKCSSFRNLHSLQATKRATVRRGFAPPNMTAIPLYQHFCDELSRQLGQKVQTGTFGADMKVALINDGPVTICMDSKAKEWAKACTCRRTPPHNAI